MRRSSMLFDKPRKAINPKGIISTEDWLEIQAGIRYFSMQDSHSRIKETEVIQNRLQFST